MDAVHCLDPAHENCFCLTAFLRGRSVVAVTEDQVFELFFSFRRFSVIPHTISPKLRKVYMVPTLTLGMWLLSTHSFSWHFPLHLVWWLSLLYVFCMSSSCIIYECKMRMKQLLSVEYKGGIRLKSTMFLRTMTLFVNYIWEAQNVNGEVPTTTVLMESWWLWRLALRTHVYFSYNLELIL